MACRIVAAADVVVDDTIVDDAVAAAVDDIDDAVAVDCVCRSSPLWWLWSVHLCITISSPSSSSSMSLSSFSSLSVEGLMVNWRANCAMKSESRPNEERGEDVLGTCTANVILTFCRVACAVVEDDLVAALEVMVLCIAVCSRAESVMCSSAGAIDVASFASNCAVLAESVAFVAVIGGKEGVVLGAVFVAR